MVVSHTPVFEARTSTDTHLQASSIHSSTSDLALSSNNRPSLSKHLPRPPFMTLGSVPTFSTPRRVPTLPPRNRLKVCPSCSMKLEPTTRFATQHTGTT